MSSEARDAEHAIPAWRRPPRFLRLRSSKNFILATVCVAIFTDAWAYGVVVPVLPFSLRERSHVSEDQVQWWNSFIFAMYGVAIIVGSPLCGWIADHTSNRTVPYFVGLICLGAATLLFGVAQSVWLLLFSRFLQGLSSAVVYTVGLALLTDTVGRNEVGQWMGTALSSSSVGLIVGPLLGGIIYARVGYAAVFGLTLALIGNDIVMRSTMIEKKVAAHYIPVKFPKPSITPIPVYGTTSDARQPRRNSRSSSIASRGRTASTFSSSSPTSPLLRDYENTSVKPHPETAADEPPSSVVPRSRTPALLHLLAMPRVLAAIYGIFVNVGALSAFDGVLPLFVEETFGWDALAAGAIFLCLAVPALAGPAVGWLCDRCGPRWIAVAGCALAAPPLVALRLVTQDALAHKALLCALLTACGFALILIVAPIAADLSFCVEAAEREQPERFGPGGAYAQAFALFNCTMAAATLFGSVMAGWLREQYGWPTLTLAMGIFVLSGTIPAVFFTGGWIFDQAPQKTDRTEQDVD